MSKQVIYHRLLALLVSTPFLGIGIGVLHMLAGQAIYDWQQMKTWRPVDAQVIDGGYEIEEGDDSDTYRAFANYTYEYEGISYRGTRVAISSGADNIGDFQQQLGRRLEHAKQAGIPLQVWVNPADPKQSIVNRDLRLEMLTFELAFAFLFGGVGVAFVVLALFGKPEHLMERKPPAAAMTRPWLRRKEWSSASICCMGKMHLIVFWIVATFCTALALPAVVTTVSALSGNGSFSLREFVFIAIGAGALFKAIQVTLTWRRFGRVTLRMNPYPGAIGGQVGGSFSVQLTYDSDQVFKAVLSCTKHYSVDGKSQRQKIWEKEIRAHTSAAANGTEVRVAFDVPSGLPESTVQGRDPEYSWQLKISGELPGVDFNRTFEIPVFKIERGAAARTVREEQERRTPPEARGIVYPPNPRRSIPIFFILEAKVVGLIPSK